ncbi:hypothetical protein ACPR111641_01255 [Acinetobacter pragensis]
MAQRRLLLTAVKPQDERLMFFLILLFKSSFSFQ